MLALVNVGIGSKADVFQNLRNVRFRPEAEGRYSINRGAMRSLH
jgi:hypothetical protein